MEEDRIEEGAQWTSFASRDHDLRMQNRVREYDSYDNSSRLPTRSGQYVDANPSSRGPVNMKTLLANQQVAARRISKPFAVPHDVIRKEGPNWILIVGGALFTALGVMIVRRRKPSVSQDRTIQKAGPTLGKDRVQQSGLSFATTRRESTGSRTSEVSTDSPYSGDPFILDHAQPQSLSEGSRVGSDSGDEECVTITPPAIYYSQFSKASNHSNRTVITPTSPPGSYRGADTSATECNDPIALSPPARLRRDMVHRLRQQLKSRDEMILDMQAQVSDQERTISLHQAHCRDLEVRLEAARQTLFDSDREIQRLRKAVADYLGSHVPNSGTWDLPSASSLSMSTLESEKRCSAAHQTSQQDETPLVREAWRLAEELRFCEDEKRELERLASLRIKEHDLVVQRLQELEAELEDARKSGFGKDLLLEAYEMEHENLEDKVDNLKRELETKTPERSPAPSSMIGRQSLSGGLGSLKLAHDYRGSWEEKYSPKPVYFRQRARSVVGSCTTLFERSSQQSPRDVSTPKGWIKTDESSSNGDASEDSEAEDSNTAFSEKLLITLQLEVEQLSVILGNHSDIISEKRLEASRLVDEFQRHNALITDIQRRMDENMEGKQEEQEQDWESFSHSLSFSNDATSTAQVQELSHKLEQIAKQQRVEEEIAELSKHQVKIVELKERVKKLLNKCNNSQESNEILDLSTREQASKMAAAGLELAKKLASQEEQARRTSREVQRLSASCQLSSPYVPRSKKEELRKMLQDASSESLSPPMEVGPQDLTNMSHVVSVAQSRFSTGSEGKPKESGDILFDRAISVSSAETDIPVSEGGLTLQMQEQYVYRPGFSGPSTRKSRRGFPINSGSGKEQSPGAKRRTARGVKKSVSSEPEKQLVRSDSNRWVNRVRQNVGSVDFNSKQFHTFPETPEHHKFFTRGQSWGAELAHVGEWSKEDAFLYPQSVQLDGPPMVRSHNPVSRRQSGGFSDSSMMTESPAIARHNVSLETSIESTKGSFGRFLFNIERGNQVFAANQDGDGRDGVPVNGSTPLSPFSKMISSLDLKELSPPSGLEDCDSLGSSMSGLSTEMAFEIRGKSQQDRSKNCSGSTSESSISIDSSFDALLNNTLDDLVRACSTPSTPAETAESSLMSTQSDTKSDGFYQM